LEFGFFLRFLVRFYYEEKSPSLFFIIFSPDVVESRGNLLLGFEDNLDLSDVSRIAFASLIPLYSLSLIPSKVDSNRSLFRLRSPIRERSRENNLPYIGKIFAILGIFLYLAYRFAYLLV
jgi:hypothetical protein